jgi:hypothetical protein
MEGYSTQNLFARELAAALEQHGATLEDLQRAPLRVHRITIKRLRNALAGRVPPKSPKLSMLSPETLRDVIEEYELTGVEVARLKAAILANAVGLKLLDRCQPDRVLEAVEHIFQVLVEVLQEGDVRAQELLLVVQKGSAGLTDDELEELFEPVAMRYDQATLALNMSYEFGQTADRVASARQAQLLFQEALAELSAFPTDLRQTEYWQLYHTGSRAGLAQAIELIQAHDDDTLLG